MKEQTYRDNAQEVLYDLEKGTAQDHTAFQTGVLSLIALQLGSILDRVDKIEKSIERKV
jgi:hypothetical protein